jgi:hypothetical protein
MSESESENEGAESQQDVLTMDNILTQDIALVLARNLTFDEDAEPEDQVEPDSAYHTPSVGLQSAFLSQTTT